MIGDRIFRIRKHGERILTPTSFELVYKPGYIEYITKEIMLGPEPREIVYYIEGYGYIKAPDYINKTCIKGIKLIRDHENIDTRNLENVYNDIRSIVEDRPDIFL